MNDLKQNLHLPLLVQFENVKLSEVESVEFIFRQYRDQISISKSSVYKSDGSGDAQLSEQIENTIIVPFTPEDTRKFSNTFFMDLRIKMEGKEFEPMVDIIELTMGDTLFDGYSND